MLNYLLLILSFDPIKGQFPTVKVPLPAHPVVTAENGEPVGISTVISKTIAIDSPDYFVPSERQGT